MRQQGLDRLLLGGVDEATGVDDHGIGAVHGDEHVPGGSQRALESGGIGFVLGAPERADGEADGSQGVSGSS